MTKTLVELSFVKKNCYCDSISLLAISSKLQLLNGVEDLHVVMGTAHNKSILSEFGLLTHILEDASSRDLMIACRVAAPEASSMREVLSQKLETLLSSSEQKRTLSAEKVTCQFIRDAVKQKKDLNLALISVPGEYATREAFQALRQGMNVMMFSKNVPLKSEKELKEFAIEHELLMMGADCGTAIINGKGLGFSNNVRKGDVGIVGASATGIQEISVLCDRLELGISHAIGTGGRDLHRDIGGAMMLRGVELLENDPGTSVIVCMAKSPDPTAVQTVIDRLLRCQKPVILCFLGYDGEVPESIRVCTTLTDTVMAVADMKGVSTSPLMPRAFPKLDLKEEQSKLYGLFCGGALCCEATSIIGEGHTFIDFGANSKMQENSRLTMEPSHRKEYLETIVAEPETAVVLCDVVCAYGAHSNPAKELVDVIQSSPLSDFITFVASVTATEADTPSYAEQVTLLREAGVVVAPSSTRAAELVRYIWADAMKGKTCDDTK